MCQYTYCNVPVYILQYRLLLCQIAITRNALAQVLQYKYIVNMSNRCQIGVKSLAYLSDAFVSSSCVYIRGGAPISSRVECQYLFSIKW
jgi:hypothetical protein